MGADNPVEVMTSGFVRVQQCYPALERLRPHPFQSIRGLGLRVGVQGLGFRVAIDDEPLRTRATLLPRTLAPVPGVCVCDRARRFERVQLCFPELRRLCPVEHLGFRLGFRIWSLGWGLGFDIVTAHCSACNNIFCFPFSPSRV